VVGGRRCNRLPRGLGGGRVVVLTSHLHLDVSLCSPPGTLQARAPAPKNGVAKPGPRAETPQPTTAHTRTLARKRGSPISQASHDAQIERRNSSGPDLRGDWG
jgi:hypothetical protein